MKNMTTSELHGQTRLALFIGVILEHDTTRYTTILACIEISAKRWLYDTA